MKRLLTTMFLAFVLMVQVSAAGAQAQFTEDTIPQGYTGEAVVTNTLTGSVWHGTLQNGVREGWAEETYGDGTWYKGNFGSGIYEGMGSMLLPDGSIYRGEFYRGAINGTGSMTYPDGTVYIGGIAHSLPNGYGRKTFPDGTYAEGLWSEDALQDGPLAVINYPGFMFYEGEISDGQPSGEGAMTLPDGTRMEGAFYGGFPIMGIYTWPDGVKGSKGDVASLVGFREADNGFVQPGELTEIVWEVQNLGKTNWDTSYTVEAYYGNAPFDTASHGALTGSVGPGETGSFTVIFPFPEGGVEPFWCVILNPLGEAVALLPAY